ncbi:MAG: cysteine desulfurase NifS [Firmicutes bacterium]|nr:cysteine desulfurase NifS [Bacillota bacterium]
MKQVYFDHAATTPVDPRVFAEMKPYLTEKLGNPSSIYAYGREARKAIDDAREIIANCIGATAQEIVFTSGGTESDNLAIKGVALALKDKGRHIITSAIEHHAVLDSVKFLEKHGFKVTYLPVDSEGMVDVKDLENAITDETILITIMHANNEIGTIQPIKEIGEIAKKHNIVFHSDAVQTVGVLPIDVNELNVDLLTFSAHKLYGPKGVGALYVRKGVRLGTLIHGGGQERKRRAGTENVAGIVGFAKAVELAVAEQKEVNQKVQELRERLFKGLESIPHIRFNGSRTHRLPNNVNVCFEFIEGESLLLNLDMNGIAASSGSACTSGSLDPSHVLLAIGLSHEIAHGSLRLTLGKENTAEEVDYVVEKLEEIVQRLRDMSPLYNG